ncbi:SNF2-related protein [Deinococcus proteolyticus MRP]|uniref:SNF2-related protein n=1 Tax=Deinococcus proteolyticus (strain ATCC 35074 / DSM 20540 / JCM 6276 / NBRC 101906 / NCIMB 13154 / VKM Ac-1939 / CCM 2703 / MRP) TaxID=693977 RepID=F0RMG6_DEIPM|nr:MULTISPECIES: DEAD/DEAH box helicase [Deinococcus]ADY26016.1 SNF2-related protein [Deinococcus proteolyticus MRP]MCY1702137.1 DEAD/DEAH box helicase [Deinococcus sp. SL84]
MTAPELISPDLGVFGPATLQAAHDLPEGAVKGLKLRRVPQGVKGNARVRAGKRWFAQRFVLDMGGQLLDSRCSCGENRCPHLARVLSGTPLERAQQALAEAAQADSAAAVAVPDPSVLDSSGPESSELDSAAPASQPLSGAAQDPEPGRRKKKKKKRTAAADPAAEPAQDAQAMRPAGSRPEGGRVSRARAAEQYGPLLRGLRRPETPRRGQALRYRLNLIPDPDGGPVLVSVGAEQARYTRSGTLLPEQPLELPPASSLEWRRGWLDTLPPGADNDRELLRGLSEYGDPATLNDQPVQLLRREPLTDHLLAALLATGRLHAGADPQPLAPGPARQLRYTWTQRRGGVQQFGLRAPSGLSDEQLFGLHSRWYLDREGGQLGEVLSLLPPEVEAALLALPPVPPEQAAATRTLIAAQMHDLLGEQAGRIPLPQAMQEHAEVAAHQPVLTLLETGVLAGRGKHRQLQQVAAAELHHEYAGQRLDGSEGAAQTLYRRDPDAEAQAERQLTGTGLQPLAGLFPAATGPQHPDLDRLYSVTDPAEWYRFLEEVRPRLEEAGFRVDLDPSFPYRFAEVEDWYGSAEEESGGGWFDLELGVTVGGQRHSLLPLLAGLLDRQPELLDPATLAALPSSRPLLTALPDGRTLALPAGRVRDILSVLVELHLGGRSGGPLRMSVLDASRLAELDRALGLRWLGRQDLLDLGQRLQDFEGIAPVRAPRGLQAKLRPYQRQGLGWLQFLREYGLGGVLADDMGLGKTVQTLAHILTEKRAGRADLPTLVVAPTSVLGNWRAEAERFTPALRVLALHGPGRHRHFGALQDYDLVLTSYALLPRDIEQLREQSFHLVILDEAQNIKNPRSAAARAARALQARHRLALTGTPLENHLGELWSLFHFLMPGLLGSERQFGELYRTPIEKGGDAARQRALAARIRPFVLRRDKRSVARELPDKTEVVVRLELAGDQRDLYETVRANLEGRVRRELEARGLARSSVTILDALLRLRQAATDPRLVRLSAAASVQNNAKREWLRSQLPELVQEGHRVLVFSQFASLLGLLEADLKELGISYSKLTGQTRRRAEAIEQFQSGHADVFLISLKAGGVGLNLTAADTVIHLDPWWNPAAEAQATDRAYRIGQDQPVFVYKLIAAGSVEERILDLQARKAALASGVLDGGLSSAAQLTQADLDALLAPLAGEEDGQSDAASFAPALPAAEAGSARPRPTARRAMTAQAGHSSADAAPASADTAKTARTLQEAETDPPRADKSGAAEVGAAAKAKPTRRAGSKAAAEKAAARPEAGPAAATQPATPPAVPRKTAGRKSAASKKPAEE